MVVQLDEMGGGYYQSNQNTNRHLGESQVTLNPYLMHMFILLKISHGSLHILHLGAEHKGLDQAL